MKNREERKPYDVTELYKTEGMWANAARSPYFDNFTLAVVVANGVWIWIDTDYKDDNPTHWIWPVMDQFFCIYFSIELLIRFMAFTWHAKVKCRMCCDPWFLFDLGLVIMMVAETWILPLYAIASGGANPFSGGGTGVLRLLRLLRLTRMAKNDAISARVADPSQRNFSWYSVCGHHFRPAGHDNDSFRHCHANSDSRL
jgi:hypothetical protein